MPRKSPYVLDLTADQRHELEARARRYTLPYRDVVRAKIVLMAAAGLDNDEIAARLDTRREIVSKWRKRFFEHGLAGLEERPEAADPRSFPPEVVVAIKALACELPSRLGVRYLASTSPTSPRRPSAAASWPRSPGRPSALAVRRRHPPVADPVLDLPPDPHFEAKASRVLDLYAHTWNAKPLGTKDFVLSADEKTSIQARPPPSNPGSDVATDHPSRARIRPRWATGLPRRLGRAPRQGVRPLRADHRHRTVRASGRTGHDHRTLRVRLGVFWVVDNNSSHRGQAAVDRLQQHWPNARLVQLPVHASWLNQVEIYFSVIQRKVLTPNDFTDLADVESRLLAFERRYEQTAAPFEWNFTRADLAKLLERLTDKPDYHAAA